MSTTIGNLLSAATRLGLPGLVFWLGALGEANAEQAVPALRVAGRMLDLPALYEDGSLRFHVSVDPLASDAGAIPVPVGGNRVVTTILTDDFDSAGKTPWRDVLGVTQVVDGKLVARSPRNDVLLHDVKERNVQVSVDAEAAAQMGILVRYQDADNFVLAFYTPGAKTLGFHHAVDGNLGPWIGPVSTEDLTGKSIQMTVSVEGDRISATLRDDHSHTVRTQCSIAQAAQPGGVGLYHDASVPGEQRFDNFKVARLERVVPADAVQIIVPDSAANEQAVWTLGEHVRVVGAASELETPQGSLRAVTVSRVEDIEIVGKSPADETFFPRGLPNRRWLRFHAQGFRRPVCGVIYRKDDTVSNGMPLGGVDTGCTDLEASGMLGYSTIFNTHVPRRGPMNVPILGLSVGGQTWLLCDPRPKQGAGTGGYQHPVSDTRFDLKLDGLKTASEIHYWGHYPVADVEFVTDSPIQAGLRAWAPFFPGEVVDSMLPGLVFEVRLRNVGDAAHRGTIAFSFPGPLEKEAGGGQFERKLIETGLNGVEVSAPLVSYAIGVIGGDRPRMGGGLDTDGAAWSRIAEELPADDPSQAGSSAAVDFSLDPGQTKVVRFVLAWHAPKWNAGGHNWAGAEHSFTHMYARHYAGARQAAELLAQNHQSFLKRILAWQEVLYNDQTLPTWLRDSLVNNLHLIAEDGMWARKNPPLPDWVREEDGLFGMNECPRGCPQIECIPCSFYGNQPLVYFFPEAALSTLRGYKGYQYPDGAAVWIFGGCTGGTPVVDFANPTKGYQFATNGISLAAMVDRYLLCYGERNTDLVQEFYPMIKSNMIYTVNLRPEYPIGDRIIAMPTGNEGTEWFEAPQPGWRGMTAHVGGLHLAQLRIAERMAKAVGDDPFARQCAEWIQAGARSMEEKLWTGGYYLNYWEPETDSKSELVFGYQLDGEWITDQHGLPSALPQDRVKTTLATIKRCNVAVTKYGAVNYANPDGTPAQVAGYGAYSYFPPEALMLAMTYMYNGEKEFGVELARKVWHNIFCIQGYTWDMPNIMRGDVDTGERTFGNDYYQDMMLWSLPAAMAGGHFGAPAEPGGLVYRVIEAAAAD